MELSQQQIHLISSSLSIADIKAYINAHSDRYANFLKQREEAKQK